MGILSRLDDCCPGGYKSDGSQACFCRLAILDMIEDRVRNRFAAVALVFMLFAPLMGIVLLGDMGGPDTMTPVEQNFSAVFHPEKLAGQLVTLCSAEVRCENMSPAAFSAANAAAMAASNGQEGFTCPRTCVDILRNKNMTEIGLMTPPPPSLPPVPPGAPPMPPMAPDEISLDELSKVNVQVFIIGMYVLVALAMIGNSSYHSRWWVLFSSVASIAVLVFLIINLEPGSPIYGWWMTASLITITFYACICIGFIFKCLKKRPPSWTLGEQFDDVREETYLVYCQALMKRKEHPATRRLRLGKIRGDLSYLEVKNLEKQIEAAKAKKFGMLTQLKAILCDVCTSDGDGDAFFMPIRLMVAFAVGIFVQTLSAMLWIKGTIDNSNTIARIVEVYVVPLKGTVEMVSKGTAAETNEPFPVSNIEGTLAFLEEHASSLSGAVYAGGLGGCICSLVFLFACYLVMLLDFRATCLKLRTGEYPWPVKVVRFKHSWTFVGGTIANSLLTFLLNVILIGLCITLLAWTFTYWVLAWVWSVASTAIVTFAVSYCANYVLNYCFALWLGHRKNIRLRYWWMNYDLIQLFISVTTGTVTALTRILIAFGVLMIAALRIDKSMYPAWVDELYTLDTLAKGYRSMCLIYHYHNNPIVIVVARILEHDAAKRRALTSRGLCREAGMLESGSRKQLMAKKWKKTAFMVLNPAVAAYKATPREDDPEGESDATKAPKMVYVADEAASKSEPEVAASKAEPDVAVIANDQAAIVEDPPSSTPAGDSPMRKIRKSRRRSKTDDSTEDTASPQASKASVSDWL